jgi:hypothetical protein
LPFQDLSNYVSYRNLLCRITQPYYTRFKSIKNTEWISQEMTRFIFSQYLRVIFVSTSIFSIAWQNSPKSINRSLLPHSRITYNEFITCFQESWMYKTWFFFQGICRLCWSVVTYKLIFIDYKIIFFVQITEEWINMSKKCGGLGSNEFQLKWRFGTHGNWKN